MPKIAMIGAGSMIFCKTLAMDILATDALKESEICLMSRTKPKLDRMEAFLKAGRPREWAAGEGLEHARPSRRL